MTKFNQIGILKFKVNLHKHQNQKLLQQNSFDNVFYLISYLAHQSYISQTMHFTCVHLRWLPLGRQVSCISRRRRTARSHTFVWKPRFQTDQPANCRIYRQWAERICRYWMGCAFLWELWSWFGSVVETQTRTGSTCLKKAMIEDNNNKFESEQIKFQFLLRTLPIKERAAWLQVCGNRSQLSHLEQWINARQLIQKIVDK